MARTPHARGAGGRRHSALSSEAPGMPKSCVEVRKHVSELLQKPHSGGYPDEDECSAADEFASSSKMLSEALTDLQAEQ